jgi:hypothetical protein
MGDVVSNIVGAITSGIQWVRAQYRKFKVWLAEQLIKALDKGWKAALTIVALVTTSIVVGYVWQILMQNAVVVAVKNTLANIAQTIKRFTAFLQVDLIISAMNLAIILNEELYKKLAPLYDELGSFAQELELDVSYVSSFLEVDRAVLTAIYSFTDAGFLIAAQKYTDGLSTWLEKLRANMKRYAEDPSLIFTDIQADITASRVEDGQKELSRIWAAINFSGDWIRARGDALLAMASAIDAAVKSMPKDIQDAIAPWYNDAIARVRAFEEEKWKPFLEHYETFIDTVNDAFLAHGADIEEMKRRIDDPIDWLRSLLAMEENDQATLRTTLNEFFGSLTPREIGHAVKQSAPAAVKALEYASGKMGKRAAGIPTVTGEGLGGVEVTPAPGTDKEGALRETGPTPWPPGEMKADGRGWYAE